MFVTEKFQQFHTELMRLQERLREGQFAFDAESASEGKGTTTGLMPGAAWRRVLTLLERQEAEAFRHGGDLALELYKRAQYAMAALADELFLNLDWHGRDAWRQNLIEGKLFGSHRAGEQLFDRIDELLHDRESGQTEIARVYLSVLALGFQGKYRGRPEADAELEVIRRRLYRFIFGRDPRVVRGREALMPQAYAATLERPRVELPHLKPWLWAIAVIVIVWLAASHLAWIHTTGEIAPLVDEIVEGRAPGAPPAVTGTAAPTLSGGTR